MATTSAGHYSMEHARRDGKIKIQKDQGLRRTGEQEGRMDGRWRIDRVSIFRQASIRIGNDREP
jgi:hypothetical protein